MENNLLNGFNDGLHPSSGTGRNHDIKPIRLDLSNGLKSHIDFIELTKIAFDYYATNLLNASKTLTTRKEAEVKADKALESIGITKSINNAAFYDYAKRVLVELSLTNNNMDYKLYDNDALKESIDKRTYLDPIVGCIKEGSEYLVNFEVLKGDCFIDEVNNFYHENGKNTIKLITGEKGDDNPRKLFFMYNLFQIR